MITRRGSGVPSAGPSAVPALPDDARGQAVDLSAIRRTDMLVDLLASRGPLRPRLLADPALTLLCSLSSDVDTPPVTRCGAARGAVAAPPAAAAVAACAGHRYEGAHRRRTGAWWQGVAALLVVVASAMAVTGLMMASLLTRLPGLGGWERQGH